MIDAMIIVLLLLATIAAMSTAGLWLTITHDGLGIRPGPRSHPSDEFGSPQDA